MLERLRRKSTHGSEEPITVLVMAGGAGKVRRFYIPRSRLRRATYVAGAIGILLPLLGLDYFLLRAEVRELEPLRHETATQREELQEYAGWMQQISERLIQVSRLDRKLRVITSLDPAEPVPLPAVGGLEGEELEPVQVAALTRRQRRLRMLEGLKYLEAAAEAQGRRLEELISHLEDQTARLTATPSISPTRGWMTSDFGYRTSPFTGMREFHRGVDIAARSGTPVVAPAEAQVRYVGDHRTLGKTMILRHGYGIESIYGHLYEISVKSGQRVKRGEAIGAIGNTGRSTGPHLHYQIQVNGVPVDPRNYILD